MMKHSFHTRPMRNMRFLLTMLFPLLCSVVAFAAPDYVATVPCTGQPTLTPPENIIRTQGQTGAKEFEIKAASGVTVKVKEWRIEGTSVTDTTMSNWGQFQVLNDNKTMTWTLGGEAEGEFTLTALIRRSCGDGGGEGQDEVIELWSGEVVAAELQLESVTFGGGNHTIYRDTGSQAAYPSPHWQKDRTENGQPFQSPVCYTRSTQNSTNKVSVSAIFSVTPEEADQVVKVKGVASSYIFGPKDVTPDDGTVTFPMTAANNSLPNNIMPGDSFNITWYFSTDDGENWKLAGDNQAEASSANQLYVTLENPNVGKLFHTVVDVACRNASGKSSAVDVVTSIWNNFSAPTLTVRAADGRNMKYWGTEAYSNLYFYTRDLVKHADGRCGAWAKFLVDVFGTHDISSTNVMITPVVPPLEEVSSNPPIGYIPSHNTSLMIVYPTHAGQSMPTPTNNVFRNHAVVKIPNMNKTIYDPSYGNFFAQTTTAASELAWEDESIAGYVWEWINPITEQVLRASSPVADIKGKKQTHFNH